MLDSVSGQVRFSLRVTTRGAALFFAAALLALSAFECGSEEYSLAAYYPVPYGSFSRLQITRQFAVVTGSNTGPRMLMTWPANTQVVLDVTASGQPAYYNGGFLFLNESTAYPLRLIAMNGTSGATLAMSIVNTSTIESRILLYSDTSNYRYTRMQNFCYWYATTAATDTCLADPAAGTVAQWNVISRVRTAGICEGTNVNPAAAGTTYCTLCCKMGM